MKPILLDNYEDPIIVGEKLYTVDELERQNITRNNNRIPEVPFGYANEGWEASKETLTSNSQVRDFNYPQDWWDKGLGSQGYVALEEGFILSMFVSKMN